MRITCESLGSMPTGLGRDGRRTVPAVLWRWLVLYALAPLAVAGMGVCSLILLTPFLLLAGFTPLGESLIALIAFALIYSLGYAFAGFLFIAILLIVMRAKEIPMDILIFAAGFATMSWIGITFSLELAFALL